MSAKKIPTLSQAFDSALKRKIKGMRGKVKNSTIKAYRSRVKSFLRDQFDPKIGLYGSVESYLNHLKAANYSNSYIRAMKSVLVGFLAYVPHCQLPLWVS